MVVPDYLYNWLKLSKKMVNRLHGKEVEVSRKDTGDQGFLFQ